MRYTFHILSGILILLTLGACSGQQALDEGVPTISARTLIDRLNDSPDTFVLDVRTPEEYDGPLGHIDGARLIPVQELADRMAELQDARDREIYVVCRTGNRSRTATEMLTEAGYDAINVDGGMTEIRELEASD